MTDDINAPIQEVTVYADRALITRRGTIQLDAGEHELRINDLPQFQRESLRAAGRGPQGTRILNVEVGTSFHSLPPVTELLALRKELEQLEMQRDLIKARQESLKDRRHWLRALGEQSKDFARGLAQGQMKPQDCGDFFSFMANQALQDTETAQHLDLELRQIQQEIDAKKRELRHKQGPTNPDRLAARISVFLEQAGELELEISYLINGASWYPQYDVRVQNDHEQEKGEVELTYIGIVQQSTGESWDNVNLALSTARPSLAAIPPELEPWYLRVYTPPTPPQPLYAGAERSARYSLARQGAPAPAAAMAAGAYDGAPADQMAFAEEREQAPPPTEAAVETAAVERSGAAVVFRVSRSVDIPSDNSPHKTTIARDYLPCKFDYVSAPVLEEQVHQRTKVTNNSEHVLLKGEANIFQGSDYVGTTPLKQTAPGETFEVFLGIDDRIKVKRELIERTVDKGNILQSDIRRTTYAYRIKVHNYAARPRHIVVRDHLPVSQHERIKVRTLHIQPQPGEHSKLEIMVWEFTLAGDSEQKLDYRFVVEHPQGMSIIGLPTD
ncbi:MAG: mucoidy inhibitor MuiA family protein [Ktedonobacteraceae bacterium]|nr:mucoidy inhibitor MuiA family protein [Ktedonobacteraceae bacterium]